MNPNSETIPIRKKIKKTNKNTPPLQKSKNQKHNQGDKQVKKSKPNKQIDFTKMNYVQKRNYIDDILQKASYAYYQLSKNQNEPKQDDRWLTKLIYQGSITDRVEALTQKINENPLNSLQYLDLFLNLDSKQRQEQMYILRGLKDIFKGIYTKNYSIVSYQQLIENPQIAKKDNNSLAQLHLELSLKKSLDKLLELLKIKLNDNISYIRQQAIEISVDLLSCLTNHYKPLLQEIVNKFGDSDKKLIRMLNQYLAKLLIKNYELHEDVVAEISIFIYRKNLKMEAQEYALNFINILNKEKLTKKCVRMILVLYFELLSKIFKLENEQMLQSKLMNHILRGINRYLPLSKPFFHKIKSQVDDHLDIIYRQIHQNPNIRIKIQLVFLVFQIQNQINMFPDRFYRVIYDLLLDTQLPNSTSIDIFFDILLISLQKDSHTNRILAVIKRLLQLCILTNQAFTATSLIVLSKLLQTHQAIQQYFKPSQLTENLGEDEEEVFKDADQDQQTNQDQTQPNQTKNETQKQNNLEYNPTARDPKYSNIQFSYFAELEYLKLHHNPIISEFVDQLYQGKQIEYQGNPLLDFTSTSYLDRIINKQQRKIKSQGKKQLEKKGKLRMSKLTDPWTMAKVLEVQDISDVRKDEQVMLRYLQNKIKEKKSQNNQKKKKQADEMEEDEFADELFEKELHGIADEDSFKSEDEELFD